MEEETVSLCGEPFLAASIGELLHCENSFKALEYMRILQNGLETSRQPLNNIFGLSYNIHIYTRSV